ncbi:UNVERIFIED_CONTAM: hypothetical protein FKN15_035245 [Acipenser sinensis]
MRFLFPVCSEFEEAAQLLSANPEAVTRSALDLSSAKRERERESVRVNVNLSEEEGEDEEAEVRERERESVRVNVNLSEEEGEDEEAEVRERERESVRVNVNLSEEEGEDEEAEVRERERESVRVNVNLSEEEDPAGPFWICATLVFTVAISGNLSTFLLKMGDPQYHYRPQFHKVSVAGVSVFCYAWLVPLALWGFLQWRSSSNPSVTSYSFLETILWIIPVDWLRWLLILLAMALSGSVLVLTFWPVIRDDTKPASIATVTAILLLHALLAIGCKISARQPLRCLHSPEASLQGWSLRHKQ